jgi:hypothetical protein
MREKVSRTFYSLEKLGEEAERKKDRKKKMKRQSKKAKSKA